MSSRATNIVSCVDAGSPAEAAGIRQGDRIAAVNGSPVRDELDLLFFSAAPELRIDMLRDRKKMTVTLEKPEGSGTGLSLEPMKVGICSNNFIFCFISQLPKGLRRTLYVKDEDFRLSFLYGNFVTLTTDPRGPEAHHQPADEPALGVGTHNEACSQKEHARQPECTGHSL